MALKGISVFLQIVSSRVSVVGQMFTAPLRITVSVLITATNLRGSQGVLFGTPKFPVLYGPIRLVLAVPSI